MAAIYDFTSGHVVTEGLQGSAVCDEAAQFAAEIARYRGEAVLLVDDDGEWVVSPDGAFESHYRPGEDPEEDARRQAEETGEEVHFEAGGEHYSITPAGRRIHWGPAGCFG